MNQATHFEEIEKYSKQLELNPNDVSAYYARSYNKFLAGDYIGALEDTNKVLELTPQNIEANYNRAVFKFILKDYEGTIEACNTVIKFDPQHANAFLKRGDAKQALGLKEEALIDYEEAKRLGQPQADKVIEEMDAVVN